MDDVSVCFFTPLVTLLSVLPIAYGHFTFDFQVFDSSICRIERIFNLSNAVLCARLISAEIDKRIHLVARIPSIID